MLVIVFVAGSITVFRNVLAANPGPGVVNRTAIVWPEVLAGIFDVQIPITVTDIHLRVFVQQVPADIVEIARRFRRVYRQTKVTAT